MPTDDLIVFVPGIMGTVLKRDNVTLWDTSISTLLRDLGKFTAFTEQLRLPEGLGDNAPGLPSALTVGPLVGGWHVWPGKWIGGGYREFEKWLCGRFPADGRVVSFGYDWRLSIRFTAGLLKEFTRKALDDWRRASGQPDAKVVLVCHSMGGLIARHYVNALGDEQTTARIITLGTPYTGSVNAVRSLSGSVPLVPERLTRTMLTFPSVRQLLPTFRCVRTSTGMEAIGAEGLPDITADMVMDAFKLRAEGAPRPDGPPVHVLGGYRHSTLAGVHARPDRALDFYNTWLEVDDGRTTEVELGGDGTVPRFAAVPSEWSEDAAAVFRASRHSQLVNNDVLRERIADTVDRLDPRQFLTPETVFGLDIPDVVRSGDPFEVRALADDPALRLTIAVSEPDGTPRRELSGAPVNPDGTGSYRAEITLPTGVWQVAAVLSGTPPTRAGELVVATDR